MEYLRGRVSGIAIPSFVVDAPHGGGKLPILPNYIVSTSPTTTVLRNFEGMFVAYPEPAVKPPAPAENSQPCLTPGVWNLASGQNTKIEPKRALRQTRRQNNHLSHDTAQLF